MLNINLIWTVLILLSIVLITYYRKQYKINFSENLTATAKNLANTLQEEAENATEIVQEKIDLVLEEFKLMLPYLENLGFSVQSFNIEAGLLPQIKASLRGSIDDIKLESIEQIKLENATNKSLIAILNAILLAKNFHQKLESIYISVLKDIIIDIKLGITPSIAIHFK